MQEFSAIIPADRRRHGAEPRGFGADVRDHRRAVPPAGRAAGGRSGGLGNDRLRRTGARRARGRCAQRRQRRRDPRGPARRLRGRTGWREGARIAEARAPTSSTSTWAARPSRSPTAPSGSALMRDLDHALTLIEATVAAVRVPVTLKMRLGWDADSLNAPELARRAEAAGVQMITVHGRTRCQFYDGSADWSADPRGQGGRVDPGRRQWRHPLLRRRRAALAHLRRRRRDDRPRRAGPALVSRPGRALSRDRQARAGAAARRAARH